MKKLYRIVYTYNGKEHELFTRAETEGFALYMLGMCIPCEKVVKVEEVFE